MLPSHWRTRSAVVAAAAIASFSLLLSGCATAAPEAGVAASSAELRAVDSHYGAIEVPTDPQRVVAVSYDTAWQLKAVGITPVGAQDYSNYVGQFTAEDLAFIEDVPSVGAFFELNLEAVAAAKPDLIVGDALEIDDKIYKQLSAIAPTVILSAEYRGDWRTIGSGVANAVNRTDTFDASASVYDARLAELKQQYNDELTGKNWAAISEGEAEGGFSILYPTGVLGALWFKDLGATLAPGVPESNANGFEMVSAELTTEVLGEADVIVAPADAGGNLNPVITAVVESPLVKRLPALVNGNVYWVYSSVTDYESALRWLNAAEERVLKPLSANK